MTDAERYVRRVVDALSFSCTFKPDSGDTPSRVGSTIPAGRHPTTQPEDCRPCKTRHCIVTLGIAAFAKTTRLVTIAKAHFHFVMKKNLGVRADVNVSVNNNYVNKNNYKKANFNKQAGNWQQHLAFLRAVAGQDQLTVLNGLLVCLVAIYVSICPGVKDSSLLILIKYEKSGLDALVWPGQM